MRCRGKEINKIGLQSLNEQDWIKGIHRELERIMKKNLKLLTCYQIGPGFCNPQLINNCLSSYSSKAILLYFCRYVSCKQAKSSSSSFLHFVTAVDCIGEITRWQRKPLNAVWLWLLLSAACRNECNNRLNHVFYHKMDFAISSML